MLVLDYLLAIKAEAKKQAIDALDDLEAARSAKSGRIEEYKAVCQIFVKVANTAQTFIDNRDEHIPDAEAREGYNKVFQDLSNEIEQNCKQCVQEAVKEEELRRECKVRGKELEARKREYEKAKNAVEEAKRNTE
ncbi:hypothetical protein EJ08DRAFT_734752 [Tothia fuscella]|uniref:Uncharacterized protein n=1 Tax=Tothia fuscella TaxID=1048955 RepID=A0A9P4TWZ6_9PEZI|nr:hypothetical protein EJ08DRAFT_734752 [Tothia fuscella]